MLKIVIENIFNVELNSEDVHRKVIEIIHENGIDWMHACGKKGRCTTCKMLVMEGMEKLGPLTEPEEKFRELGRLNTFERLSCQAEMGAGKLVIRVADQNKFPHVKYSE